MVGFAVPENINQFKPISENLTDNNNFIKLKKRGRGSFKLNGFKLRYIQLMMLCWALFVLEMRNQIDFCFPV